MLKLCRVTKVKVLFLVLVYCTFLILTYLNFRPPFWRRVYYSYTYSQHTTGLPGGEAVGGGSTALELSCHGVCVVVKCVVDR